MFAVALLAILFAQGNALVNGDGSPLNETPRTVEVVMQDRVNAYDSIMICTRKVMNNQRVNCDTEIKHYNDVSAELLNLERDTDNAKLTETAS